MSKRGVYLWVFIKMMFTGKFYRFYYRNLYREYRRFLFLSDLKKRFPDTIIAEDILMPNPERVSIGQKSIIDPTCYFNCGYDPDFGSISIGKEVMVGFNSCFFAGGGKITIENNVDIGIKCVLAAHARSLKQNPMEQRSNFEHKYGEIHIGEGTLIGSHATILAGTVLGKYCTIAAGSVVQGIYPDNTSLAGNPCRPLPRIAFN